MANSQKNSDSFAGEFEPKQQDVNTMRIKGSDRSSLAKPASQVRNVRTSTMPGTPQRQDGRTRATIDEEFLADYQTKGVQPQSILDKPAPQPNTQKVTRREVVEYAKIPQKTTAKVKETTVHSKKTLRERLYRRRALKMNIKIVITGLSLWLLFQIPLALINIVTLGVSALFDSVKGKIQVGESNNFIISSLGSLWNSAVDLVTTLATFLPQVLFMVTYLMLFAFGALMLLTMYLLYTLRGLNPLFGNGGGTKLGIFLLAIIGYALPVLNIVPWFLFWAWAVWKYPK